jgi:hypothetical protein
MPGLLDQKSLNALCDGEAGRLPRRGCKAPLQHNREPDATKSGRGEDLGKIASLRHCKGLEGKNVILHVLGRGEGSL